MQVSLMDNILVSVSSRHWVCDCDGIWDFIFAVGTYGKTINVANVKSINDLANLVSKEFQIDETKEKFALSFWSPDVSIIVSQPASAQLCIPPVFIVSDCDVMQFVSLLKRRPETNLYLTVEALDIMKNNADQHVDSVDQNVAEKTASKDFLDDGTMLQFLLDFEADNQRRLALESGQGNGGRGEPTQFESPAVGSDIADCETHKRKKSKGKGIYVEEPPGFDLGIEGPSVLGMDANLAARTSSNGVVVNMSVEPARTSENVFIDQLSAKDFCDQPPQITYMPQPEDTGLIL